MWLLAEWMSNGMFLAGIVLLILIMFRRSYRRHSARNRRSSDPVPRRTQVKAADRALSETPDDVMKWQVEMHELARTLKAELDTKMRLLQLLIGQARVESDRLRAVVVRPGPVPDRRSETPGSDPLSRVRGRPPTAVGHLCAGRLRAFAAGNRRTVGGAAGRSRAVVEFADGIACVRQAERRLIEPRPQHPAPRHSAVTTRWHPDAPSHSRLARMWLS